MTDIVDELRSHFSGTGIIKSATSDLVKNAAAEIERLQDEVVSLGITLVGVEEVNALLRAENATLLAAAQPATALRDYLVQIRNVCRDNATEFCNHRMALDYVHQLTAAALSSAQCGSTASSPAGSAPARRPRE